MLIFEELISEFLSRNTIASDKRWAFEITKLPASELNKEI
jgi:hypothetical protein